MNARTSLIASFFILAALFIGLFFGERTGEKIAMARIQPKIQDLESERDEQARYITWLNEAINFFQDSFRHTATASWYGDKENGNLTASGEIFDSNLMTAASPYLPLNTWWTITDIKSHRSVTVRINDRGPWIIGRGIDLSRAAAMALGIEMAGLARVILIPKIGKGD